MLTKKCIADMIQTFLASTFSGYRPVRKSYLYISLFILIVVVNSEGVPSNHKSAIRCLFQKMQPIRYILLDR